MSQLILSIDQGTTGTKATLFNRKGGIVKQAYCEFPQLFPKPGWVEHCAEDILQSIESTVKRVTSRRSATKICCIGITNQRETVFAWNRERQKMLAPGIVWQCRRTADVCDKLKKSSLAQTIHRKTGLLVDAYFSATKMAWLLKYVKAVRQAEKKKTLAFGTVDSLVLFFLTGGEVHATEPSNASRTMLYNIQRNRYDSALLKQFHIPAWTLPKVYPSGGLFGRTKGLSFLPDGIPITGILGDQQAALFGQGCFQKGVAKNTYGTGAFVLMNIGKAPFFSRRGLLTTIAWQIGQETTYALEGSIFICGASVQWLRDGLKIIQSAKETEALARKVKDSGGVVFVPALVGLGAPHWDPYARGTIFGITRGTTKEHLVRATLESLALQVDEVLKVMQEETKIRLKELRVDGGASENRFLLQLQSDMIKKKVVQGNREATGIGAAYLAGLSAGVYASLKELTGIVGQGKAFHPKRSSAIPLLKKKWQKAVNRAKGWAK